MLLLQLSLLLTTTTQAQHIFTYDNGHSVLPEDICDFTSDNSINSNTEAEEAVDKLLSKLGIPRNFAVVQCPDIENAVAFTSKNGERYIICDNDFILRIRLNMSVLDAPPDGYSDLSALSILLHQIGHHLSDHTFKGAADLEQMRTDVLEADRFSGYCMYKLGTKLSHAQQAVHLAAKEHDDNHSSQPKLNRRLAAIEEGYMEAFNQDPNRRELPPPPPTQSDIGEVTLDSIDFSYVEHLPGEVSLKKYCPTPGDQGQSGSVVGWAVAYHAMTIVNAIKNNWTDEQLISENTFSPSFLYELIRAHGCSGGARIEDALKVLIKYGVPKCSDFQNCKFECYPEITEKDYSLAAENKMENCFWLFGMDDFPEKKVMAIKQSLSEGIPVIVGMSIRDNFTEIKSDEVWNPNSGNTNYAGGTAFVIIGYDEDKFGGSVEIINSWGKDWANNGFTWIKYEDLGEFVKYGYIIKP
jgi:hypothetical protein